MAQVQLALLSDVDGDNVPDGDDNCPNDPNPGQENADGDQAGDVCDGCPNEPALTQPEGPTETECADGIDNDCDGSTDGADADCQPADCTCGDVDRSGGSVNLSDFGQFALCYGSSEPAGDCTTELFDCSDLDGSGSVSLSDFGLFALWYGQESTQYPPNCEP